MARYYGNRRYRRSSTYNRRRNYRKQNVYLSDNPFPNTRVPQRRVRIPRNPFRYRAPITQITRVRRSVQQLIPLNLSFGFTAGVGGTFDLTIAFALSAVSFWQGGAITYQPLVPSASEFAVLWEHYRITRVNIRAIFSNNESGVNAPNTVLPVLHIMNDYNSTSAQSLVDYEQHPELKTYQLGVDKDIYWSVVPRVRGDVLTDGDLLSTSANSQAYQWIDTSAANVQHLGVRVYMNNFGRSGNTDIGTVMFMIEYEMELRNMK